MSQEILSTLTDIYTYLKDNPRYISISTILKSRGLSVRYKKVLFELEIVKHYDISKSKSNKIVWAHPSPPNEELVKLINDSLGEHSPNYYQLLKDKKESTLMAMNLKLDAIIKHFNIKL